MMNWWRSNRADIDVLPLADRHYNRQAVGSRQFVAPGYCLVLKTDPVDAFWVSLRQKTEYVKHEWPGAWLCSAFRNEGSILSSDLIREAVAATRAKWNDLPPLGMITFVDPDKVKRKRDPGRCFIRAGFRKAGYTKGGLLALQMIPEDMPPAAPANEHQRRLIA